MQASVGGEEAVSDFLEDVVEPVLDLIRVRELDLLARDKAVASVTRDIHKIYSTIDIRYCISSGCTHDVACEYCRQGTRPLVSYGSMMYIKRLM